MADSTIDSELFNLIDNWPGSPLPGASIPQDGFLGATHHNVASPAFPIGTKIQVYCDGSVGKAGYATLMYLKVGTQNADSVIAAKSVCIQDSATVWSELTNDPDSCIALPTGLVAIALSAMTDGYYGWFWVGGVCPEQYVSGLAGNYATDGNVAAGAITAKDLTADYVGLGANTVAASGNAETLVAPVTCGYAIAADA